MSSERQLILMEQHPTCRLLSFVRRPLILLALVLVMCSLGVSQTSSYPWVNNDMWVDFEQGVPATTITATQLANSTHGAPGTWITSSCGALCSTQSAGEDPGHAATGDHGTRGMAYNLANGSEAFVQWNLPVTSTSLSFGMWYRTGAPAAWTEGPHFITLSNFAFGNMLRLSDERSSADNSRVIRVSPLDNTVIVQDNTWYWVTMKWTQHGAGSFSVYDTSLHLVGTTNFVDTGNVPAHAILLGNSSGTPGEPGETTYFDDLVVDYTHAAFPLLPKQSVVSIAVTPANVSIAKGTTQQYTAT